MFDGQLGYLDHALANASANNQVVGATDWHINADEVPVFDYNDEIRDTPGEDVFEREPNGDNLYEPNEFRTSDHDPVIIGLDLPDVVTPTPTPTNMEADVVPRADGDGVIESTDTTQVQRFEIGLDRPFQSNEFQRADSAPRNTSGNGVIDSADTTQAQRYEIGLDAPQSAGGANAPGGSPLSRGEPDGDAAGTGLQIQSAEPILFAGGGTDERRFCRSAAAKVSQVLGRAEEN